MRPIIWLAEGFFNFICLNLFCTKKRILQKGPQLPEEHQSKNHVHYNLWASVQELCTLQSMSICPQNVYTTIYGPVQESCTVQSIILLIYAWFSFIICVLRYFSEQWFSIQMLKYLKSISNDNNLLPNIQDIMNFRYRQGE